MTKHCFECEQINFKAREKMRPQVLVKDCLGCKIQAPRQSLRPQKPVRKQPRGK